MNAIPLAANVSLMAPSVRTNNGSDQTWFLCRKDGYH